MSEKERPAKDSRPLKDEAEAREKWRGGETLLTGSGDDTHLPASEADTASSTSSDEDQESGSARPGAFAPPD